MGSIKKNCIESRRPNALTSVTVVSKLAFGCVHIVSWAMRLRRKYLGDAFRLENPSGRKTPNR